MSEKGLVYVFTGDGKGKTSAALGVAMRAVGQGKRVAMVQWYKEKRWRIGEHKLPELLARSSTSNTSNTSKFEIYPMGQGFYKLPTDHATPNQHKQAAQDALKLARELLEGKQANRLTGQQVSRKRKPASPFGSETLSTEDLITCQPDNLFLLILDESLNAVNDGLISLISLTRLIRQRKVTHIILTGRNAPKKIVDIADLLTDMKNIKHPYDKGKKAVMGLDY